MTGDGQDLEFETRQWRDLPAIGDRAVDHRDLAGGRAMDGDRPVGEQLVDAVDMVPVVMGDEDRREPPAALVEGLDDRAGGARVDDGDMGVPCRPDGPDIVVAKGRYRREFDLHVP